MVVLNLQISGGLSTYTIKVCFRNNNNNTDDDTDPYQIWNEINYSYIASTYMNGLTAVIIIVFVMLVTEVEM